MAKKENSLRQEEMVRTNLYVPGEHLKELKIKLIRQNKSVSQWFREEVQRYLDDKE